MWRLLTVFLAATALQNNAAQACQVMQPLPPGYYTVGLFPADGASEVPLNASVWLGGVHSRPWHVDYERAPGGVEAADPTLALVDAAGEAVGGRFRTYQSEYRESQGAVLYDRFIPDMPLEADTHYRVMRGDEIVSEFTTGAAADEAAPAVPTVELLDRQRHITSASSVCRERTGGATVAPSGDDETILFLVSRQEVPVSDDAPYAALTEGAPSFVDAHNLERRFSLRVRAVDLAGNLSEPSEPIQVRLGLTGRRCDHGGTLSVFGWPLLLVGLRRRRAYQAPAA